MKAALEHSARVNRRSQNAEAIVWLEERTGSIGQRWREPDLLRRIEQTPWVTEMTPDERYVASARRLGCSLVTTDKQVLDRYPNCSPPSRSSAPFCYHLCRRQHARL